MEESCGEGEGEEEEEGEEEDGDDMSQNSNSSKRQRRDSGSGRSSSSNIHGNRNYNTNGMPMELWSVYIDSESDVGLPLALGGVADTSCHGTPLPLPLPLPGDNTDTATTTRRRAASLISNMVTTSIAERAPSCSGSDGATTTKETFEYKDWEEIKETLACASELCDRAWLCLLCPSYRRDVNLNYHRRRPVRFHPSPQGSHPSISPFSPPFPGSFTFLLETCSSGIAQREVQFTRFCPHVRAHNISEDEEHNTRFRPEPFPPSPPVRPPTFPFHIHVSLTQLY